MASISLTRTTEGSVSDANANLNNNWTKIESLVNGGLDNSNIAAAAAISPSKFGAGGAAASDALLWNGTAWAPAKITDAHIAAGAAIAKSKLGALSIADADVSAGAAIALSKLNVPRVRLTKVAELVAHGARPAVTWGAETYDTDGMHDNVTNPQRITIKTAGVYQFVARVAWDTNGTGYREAAFFVSRNGAAAAQESQHTERALTDYWTGVPITDMFDLGVNDYVEVRSSQVSGGDLNILGGSLAFFAAHRIA